MNIKLAEVYNRGIGSEVNLSLRSVYINPVYVVCLREDSNMKRCLHEGGLPEGIDKRQEFTRVTINKGNHGQDITVIGTLEEIQKKLLIVNKELLRG
tara:strand:- start:23 stop:313 length:291 start_codon:yes stop_codon:yes gene_type:complete